MAEYPAGEGIVVIIAAILGALVALAAIVYASGYVATLTEHTFFP